MRDIGKNIRTMRQRKNMTQDAMAESLYVTRQTVSNYETGKSRPDIDMLMRIADVLDTDMNTLLYGPVKAESRKEDVRALFIALSLCLVTGIPLAFSLAIEKALRNPAYGIGILRFTVVPLFLLALGWTLMQGIGLLTNSKPLKVKRISYLYWLVLAVVLLYFVVELPENVHEIKGHFVGLYVDKLVPPYHLSSYFHYNPAWLSFLSGKLYWLKIYNKWLFFAAGTLLWLLREEKRRTKQVGCALFVALVLSICIYLFADSDFVLQVKNPEQLTNVPYGIVVEQYTDE